MASRLVELNQLQLGENGVYSTASAVPFDYSDGVESELRLREVLSAAQDLTSQSSELAQHITDWPSEYHLSSLRANLLRPLNLSGVTRVLELGCGCGAITRYLAEQGDLHIDAIEGSPVRAELAALRCRDMSNVTISTGNFNKLEMPAELYDLILFVGVTEYAGRFSDRDTDVEALQDLLAIAKRAVTADGVVLIAIENRLGLKYALGACEDHYGQPWVGIDNYPDATGIRTYSRAEWQQQIDASDFTASTFAYPFPDYKIPTLLVHEQTQSPSAPSLGDDPLLPALAKIRSRDYLKDFDLGPVEGRLWQAQYLAGTLPEVANSFLILLAEAPESLQKICDFAVAEFPAPPAAYLVAALPADDPEPKELELQVAHLQRKIAFITGSRGWRFLNRVRRWLGRSVIES